MQKITPCLWFDGQAEEAAEHYVAIFGGDSRILDTTYVRRRGTRPGGLGAHGRLPARRAGLHGAQRRTAVPLHRGDLALRRLRDQAEVDRFWDALSEGGEEGQCGWLKDKFGVSWQIVPNELPRLLADPDPAKAGRAMKAMLGMRKLDIQALRDA